MQVRLNALRSLASTITLTLVCSVGLCACAGPASRSPQQVNDWPKSDGRFRAELFVTDRHEQFERDWVDAVNQGKYPIIVPVEHVRKGQEVHVVLLFANCIAVKDDICRMTVDFSVTKPDGTEYGSIPDRSLWSGEPPTRDLVYLGRPYMSFEADPVDPVGHYQITAVVRGADGAISVVIARPLVVTEDPN